ncbi:MAG: RdgB/HAM1 family non-canonical purine NTP pyrophosphatase [Alphaproteobacteria bacterium]
MQKLIFATHNAHKLSEVRAMLEPIGIEVIGAADINLPDVEENGATFRENALLKARSGYRAAGMPVLAEDAGLCIRALNGEPGIYTKRYAEANGGFPAVFEVLSQRLNGQTDRSAYFCCTMVLVSDTQEQVFEGILEGDIIDEPCGNNGFGYDPVFVPKGAHQTVAEMSEAQKNKISHRYLALKQVVSYLTQTDK